MRQPGPALLQPKRPLTGWKSGAEDFPLSHPPPPLRERPSILQPFCVGAFWDRRETQAAACLLGSVRMGHSEEHSSWLEQDH